MEDDNENAEEIENNEEINIEEIENKEEEIEIEEEEKGSKNSERIENEGVEGQLELGEKEKRKDNEVQQMEDNEEQQMEENEEQQMEENEEDDKEDKENKKVVKENEEGEGIQQNELLIKEQLKKKIKVRKDEGRENEEDSFDKKLREIHEKYFNKKNTKENKNKIDNEFDEFYARAYRKPENINIRYQNPKVNAVYLLVSQDHSNNSSKISKQKKDSFYDLSKISSTEKQKKHSAYFSYLPTMKQNLFIKPLITNNLKLTGSKKENLIPTIQEFFQKRKDKESTAYTKDYFKSKLNSLEDRLFGQAKISNKSMSSSRVYNKKINRLNLGL